MNGAEMDHLISLHRHYREGATTGRLRMPGGWTCCTLEPPWRGNAVGESCIPEGIYTLTKRRSEVVERTSDGEFIEGWEITAVPGRTWIMFHAGNYPRHTDGCVLLGEAIGSHEGAPAVWSSDDTMRAWMNLMARRESWLIDVRFAPGEASPQWP